MRFNQGFISRSALRRIGAAGLALSLLAGGAVVAQSALTKVPSEVQPGDYKLDPEHGKITWSVDHLGFSTYVGQFVNVQAELKLDPANPSASILTATIPLADVASNSAICRRRTSSIPPIIRSPPFALPGSRSTPMIATRPRSTAN